MAGELQCSVLYGKVMRGRWKKVRKWWLSRSSLYRVYVLVVVVAVVVLTVVAVVEVVESAIGSRLYEGPAMGLVEEGSGQVSITKGGVTNRVWTF